MYDRQTQETFLIDPRGAERKDDIYIDAYYDVCKLSHSILGGYDFINMQKYRLSVTNDLKTELVFAKKYPALAKDIFADHLRTHEGKLGRINKHTVPVLLDWLERHDIPYDELLLGKPWPGPKGFHIDDKAIRPKEFLSLSEEEIVLLLEEQKCH